jgi:hypothetical protein
MGGGGGGDGRKKVFAARYSNLCIYDLHVCEGHAVAQLVGALHYKPEGRGFDSRWCH